MSSLLSARWGIALGGLLFGLNACEDLTAPRFGRPPYLAILVKGNANVAGDLGTPYRYHVRELSGTLHLDTTITADPLDTIILSVKPATYVVSLAGVPPQCRLRDGADQAIVIPPNSNTSAIRYVIDCRPILRLVALSDGAPLDSDYIYRLIPSDGVERIGLLHANDTLGLNHIPPGPASVELLNLSGNCIVISDGGSNPSLVLDSLGGNHQDFRIHCSDPAHRPALVSFLPSYHDGAAGVVFRVRDPDHDANYYAWDLTNCRRKSLLPTGARTRPNMSTGVATNGDSVTALAAFEIGLPDDSVRGKCLALWVGDRMGNLSQVEEAPFTSRPGLPPTALQFNAKFLGTQAIRTQLSAADPDGDFLGTFVTYKMRDGILGPPDGEPDYAVINVVDGYPGTSIPDLTLYGGILSYENFYGVVAYLFDAAGNFTRVEDDVLFQ